MEIENKYKDLLNKALFLWNRHLTSTKSFFYIVATLLFILFITLPKASYSQKKDTLNTKKILLINSYHLGYFWSDEILKGIQEGIRDSKLNIELLVEFLDTKRFPNLNHLDDLAEAMLISHKHINYDLIITSDNNAFDFAVSHRQKLFPEQPIVFSGLNEFQISDIKNQKNITGINEAVEIKSTIDMALDIHPDTENLLFITSTIRETEKRNYNLLQEINPLYADKYKIELITNKSIEEIERITSKVSKKSLVFILAHPVNKGLSEYVQAKSFTKKLAATSSVPVYSPWDIYIGNGVLGGNVITGKLQGTVAANMAIQILSGASIDDVPIIIKTPTSPMFDFNAMKRFGVSLKDIPTDSIVINEKLSFYKEYKLYIWSTIIAILFLSIVIIVLSALLKRSNFLKRQLYSEQAKLIESERALKTEKIFTKKILDTQLDTFFVLDPKTGRALRWNKVFEKLTGYTTTEIAEMKAPDSYYSSEDQKKAAIFIESTFGEGSGVIELDLICKNGEKIPTEYAVSILYDEFGNPESFISIGRDVTDRKQAEQELIKAKENAEESQKSYSEVVETTSNLITVVDKHGKFIFVNHASKDFFGLMPQKCIGKMAFEFIHPDDREYTENKFTEWISSENNEFTFENRLISNTDETTYVSWNIHMERSNGEIKKLTSIGRNITKQKEIETALRESEKRFKTIFEGAPVGIALIDSYSGQFLHVNKKYCDILSLTEEEMLSTNFQNITHPDDLLEDLNNMAKLQKGEIDSFEMEKRYVLKNKSVIWVRLNAVRLWDEIEKPFRYITIVQDITEYKQAEETLQKSEMELNAIYQNTPLVMLLVDEERRIMKMNAQALLMSYKLVGEALGLQVGEALRCHYADNDPRGCGFSEVCETCKIRNTVLETIKTGKSFHQVESLFVYRGNDGIQENHMLVSTSQIKLSGEKRVLICLQDITKRKQAEQEIKRKERQYRSLVETSRHLIWICDLQGKFTYLNPAWEKTHGYKLKEMLGKPFSDFQRPEIFERDMIEFSRHLAGGSVEDYETSHIKKNGKDIYLVFNAIPLKNDNGKIVGTQGTAYDITEHRQIQKKVLNAAIQAEEAERKRIAQDLHDGIGPILSTIKLLTQIYLSSDDEKFKQKVEPQLVSGINEALSQVSTISQNLSPHILSDFGLEVAIKRFIDKQIEVSKLEIKFKYQLKERLNKELELTVYRISIELLNNTVKHAKASNIELSIIQDKENVYLDYFDNGKGFNFNKVKQGKKGMGLFNIYNRIKSMNGNMEFPEKEGVGIFYNIYIPLQ